MGRGFSELERKDKIAITNTVIRLVVIKSDSHSDVKFEVFERFNLGAEKLNDQELRNCVYRGSYNKLLADLAENDKLLKIQGLKKPHQRMADRQLILRFLALHRLTHLHYRGNMKQVMNRELEEHLNPSHDTLKKQKELFEKVIDMAWHVFGDKSFRRFIPGNKQNPNGDWEKRLNFALWDTVLYCFSFYEKSDIIPNSDRIFEEFIDLMTNDSMFIEYVASTGDKAERLKYRAEVWGERLKKIIGLPRSDARIFTRKLKQELYDTDPTCNICHQNIKTLDDAAVDHILHYWRGGKTVPENARLTHRYCNQVRGGREDSTTPA